LAGRPSIPGLWISRISNHNANQDSHIPVGIICLRSYMEQDRIISEYKTRESRGDAGRYSMLGPANELNVHGLEHKLLGILRAARFGSLEDLEFLDVGCGTGGQLLRWIQWGAKADHCAGIDLVAHRLEQARLRLPAAVRLVEGDASQIPFASESFDVTTQFTMFSSILDDAMQAAVAREMLRVTKRGGMILSYDFWINPSNPATKGIRVARLRELFPDCQVSAQRITLAPPIGRRLAPISPVLCRLLEGLKLLNSHFLAIIRPRTKN
jgi:SAM-dependent methyltransferase